MRGGRSVAYIFNIRESSKNTKINYKIQQVAEYKIKINNLIKHNQQLGNVLE